MKLDCVIFDLDGTILDTLEDLKNSVNFALRKNGFPERSLDEIRLFVGNGIRLLIKRAVPENTNEVLQNRCFEDFKAHYKAHSADNTAPYKGIIPLLNQLTDSGIKLAVVSNKADFVVKDLVKNYFGDVFLFAVGEREGIRRKPSPDSVYEAMKMLGAKGERTIYVGDSQVDIETARNAGLPCVAVTWGFRDKMVLESLSPEYIIDKPSQLADIILKR